MASKDTVPPNRLKEIRESRCLTQKEVAKLMNLDFTTVCRHETLSRGLSKSDIEAYSKVFKVESYELFMAPLPDTVE